MNRYKYLNYITVFLHKSFIVFSGHNIEHLQKFQAKLFLPFYGFVVQAWTNLIFKKCSFWDQILNKLAKVAQTSELWLLLIWIYRTVSFAWQFCFYSISSSLRWWIWIHLFYNTRNRLRLHAHCCKYHWLTCDISANFLFSFAIICSIWTLLSKALLCSKCLIYYIQVFPL